MVMEPTDFRYRDHSAPGNREDGAGFRTIPRERHIRPPPVIIGTVAGQDARQTTTVESDMSVLIGLRVDTESHLPYNSSPPDTAEVIFVSVVVPRANLLSKESVEICVSQEGG